MIEKSFNFLFYLKSSLNAKGKKGCIYARITVDGQRTEISTKIVLLNEKWNSATGRVMDKSEKARQINSFLDSFQMKVLEARKYLMERDMEITASSIKNVLHGNTEDRKKILEIFSKHNEEIEALVGKEYAAGTMERNGTSFDHTKAFIQWKYNTDDLELKKLDYDFISQYSFWLRSLRGCAHNTTVKYLGNFKKIVLSCVKKGWLIRDPFQGFKMAKRDVNREVLSKDELRSIAEKEFAIERLGQIRDIFIFSCYTGPCLY